MEIFLGIVTWVVVIVAISSLTKTIAKSAAQKKGAQKKGPDQPDTTEQKAADHGQAPHVKPLD